MEGFSRLRRVWLFVAAAAIAFAVWTAAAQEPVPQGSASGAVAVVHGHVIAALTDLLQKGAETPIAVKTRTPLARSYAGPDAALLQLQADAIALGLEALGTAPAPKPGGPDRRANPTR
jgi:hypothetical protein